MPQLVGNCRRYGQVNAHFFLIKQHRRFTRNQCRVEVGLGKRIAPQNVPQKLHVGVQAHNMKLGQRGIQARQRFGTGRTVHNEFGHHGVVIGRYGIALPDT